MSTSLQFKYSKSELQQIAYEILKKIQSLGINSASVELHEVISTDLNILNHQLENLTTSSEYSTSIEIYIDNKRAEVALNAINISANIDLLIKKAVDIATYTQKDEANGIAESQYLCQSINNDLKLFNPYNFTNNHLIDICLDLEHYAITQHPKINKSEGAYFNTSQHNFIFANTNNFCEGYTTTNYSKSITLIGNTNKGLQTDYWYSNARDFDDLSTNKKIAQTAINRLIRKLNIGTAKNGTFPVIFESQIAKSIIANFLSAINGSNIFRKTSFLCNKINQQIFPTWISIHEDPFILKGLSSCYFDDEGVTVTKRNIVENGILKSYILSSYTARKLNLQPTGNAGGTHNIFITNNTNKNLEELVGTINSGMIITDTIGRGLNIITGDYSVGASGLWIESGEVQYFVDNITISGNLNNMLQQIEYINDNFEISNINCGDMLIHGINIAN